MRVVAVIALSVLAACGSIELKKTPRPIADAEARAIIEQVFMEQKPALRPVSVAFAPDFIALDFGTISVSRAGGIAVPVGNVAIATGGGKRATKQLNERYYYNSLGHPILSRRGNWYVVTLTNSDGRNLRKVYAANEDKASRFMDAIEAMRR